MATCFGRNRSKHVAKCNLIVIIASCLDVCCVLTVHNILYKFDMHKGMASLSQKNTILIEIRHEAEFIKIKLNIFKAETVKGVEKVIC